MNRSRIKQSATAIAICASVAAAIGIATGAAAPSNGSSAPAQAGPFIGPAGLPAKGKILRGKGAPPRIFGGPPVHSEMVVPNKAGDDFLTITQDSGKVESVSGNQLTITEGTEKATYKTVTLDIPSDATVIRKGDKAQLSDLQVGDQVHVSQSPQDTFVYAADSEFFQTAIRHHRGLPPPPGAGGLPPGLPEMAPMGRRGN